MSTAQLPEEMKAIMALADALGYEMFVIGPRGEKPLDDQIYERANSSRRYSYIAKPKSD
jgi:hypothetical protein